MRTFKKIDEKALKQSGELSSKGTVSVYLMIVLFQYHAIIAESREKVDDADILKERRIN